MKLILLVAACVAVAAALPSGQRDEMEIDDEPYYTDMEPGMDLIAEESQGVVPVMVDAPDDYETSAPEEPSPAEKERSLMLVMPLTASNDTKIEDLYTKKPVTQIVDTTTTPTPPSSTQRVGTTLVVTPTPQRKLPPAETITLPPPTIRPDIKDLLASIGLFPDTPSGAAAPAPFPLKEAADSFSPEIKELMSHFGVLPSNNDFAPTTSQPLLPTVNAASYANFKPIPDRLNVDDEMKEFLAQFGLVDRQTSSRQLTTPATPVQVRSTTTAHAHSDFKIRQKEAPTTTVTAAPTQVPTLHPDSMSNEMRKVLFELGLAPHLTRDDFHDEVAADVVASNEAPGVDSKLFEERASHEFVFNPTDAAPLNDTMEEKLKEILGTFKYLNNTDHSPAEIEQQIQEATKLYAKYKKSLSESNGPDPLATEELLLGLTDSHNDLQKRQNNETSSSTTTTTTTEKFNLFPASEETATEKAAEDTGPSLADLESSFGGGGGGDEVPDESLPPPKPNGFYFLLDLNTFLNVGEDDKGVHLRLAPRLGNSKNFLPITVP